MLPRRRGIQQKGHDATRGRVQACLMAQLWQALVEYRRRISPFSSATRSFFRCCICSFSFVILAFNRFVFVLSALLG
jgi:hypothetical protein